MRKFRTGMALVIALLNSAVALAGEAGAGPYAGLDLGKSSYRQPGSDERDPSFALTVGYRITPALALEGQARSLSLRINVPFADILADIRARDERDMGRLDAPLKPAEDALLLDTGDLTIGDAVQAAISLVESKLRQK